MSILVDTKMNIQYGRSHAK